VTALGELPCGFGAGEPPADNVDWCTRGSIHSRKIIIATC
jgi:hypothetical protein